MIDFAGEHTGIPAAVELLHVLVPNIGAGDTAHVCIVQTSVAIEVDDLMAGLHKSRCVWVLRSPIKNDDAGIKPAGSAVDAIVEHPCGHFFALDVLGEVIDIADEGRVGAVVGNTTQSRFISRDVEGLAALFSEVIDIELDDGLTERISIGVGDVQDDLTAAAVIIRGSTHYEEVIVQAIQPTDMTGAVEGRDDLHAILLGFGEDAVHILLGQETVRRLDIRDVIGRSIHRDLHLIQEEAGGVVVGEVEIQGVHLVPRHGVDQGLEEVGGVIDPPAVDVDGALLDEGRVARSGVPLQQLDQTVIGADRVAARDVALAIGDGDLVALRGELGAGGHDDIAFLRPLGRTVDDGQHGGAFLGCEQGVRQLDIFAQVLLGRVGIAHDVKSLSGEARARCQPGRWQQAEHHDQRQEQRKHFFLLRTHTHFLLVLSILGPVLRGDRVRHWRRRTVHPQHSYDTCLHYNWEMRPCQSVGPKKCRRANRFLRFCQKSAVRGGNRAVCIAFPPKTQYNQAL